MDCSSREQDCCLFQGAVFGKGHLCKVGVSLCIVWQNRHTRPKVPKTSIKSIGESSKKRQGIKLQEQ
eukprot:569802-Amphidinium_carterae.1